MLAPSHESGAGLLLEAMALIDADDAGAGTRDVAEHGLDNLQAHPQPLQARCHRAPDVVDAPRWQRLAAGFGKQAVESCLSMSDVGERPAPVEPEYMIAPDEAGAGC